MRLRLTRRERRRHAYYDQGALRGVWPRMIAQAGTLTQASPTLTMSFQATRRARLRRITWAGDVHALRVVIRKSTGELVTRSSAHIPTLSGQTTLSTRSLGALFAVPPNAGVVANALTVAPTWEFRLEPNLVIERGAVVLLDYSLENTADPYIVGGGTYTIEQGLFLYEFPAWGLETQGAR